MILKNLEKKIAVDYYNESSLTAEDIYSSRYLMNSLGKPIQDLKRVTSVRQSIEDTGNGGMRARSGFVCLMYLDAGSCYLYRMDTGLKMGDLSLTSSKFYLRGGKAFY